VLVWNASANRDEEAFTNADTFNVARDPNNHLAFAHGEHFCLGAHLARLEIRLIFEEILDRMGDVELSSGWPPMSSTGSSGCRSDLNRGRRGEHAKLGTFQTLRLLRSRSNRRRVGT
jgi:cytochrome P450